MGGDQCVVSGRCQGSSFDGYLPLGGGAALVPVERDGADSVASTADAVRLGAGGSQFEAEIIEIGPPCTGGTLGLDGGMAAQPVERVEGTFDFCPSATVDGDGVDTLECGDIVGVAHDTHLESGGVVGVLGSYPETKLDSIDRIDGGVDAGEYDALVVAVGA